MQPELHAELARAAERAGTSLNHLITTTLAGAVGFGSEEPRREADEPARRNLVALLLVVNAVVVGLAALAAIAILLVALLG